MADEAQVTSQLVIRVGNLDYRSNPPSFRKDVSVGLGPTPGAMSVSVAGTDINLSQLTHPGLCRLMNLDTVNNVVLGVWNPDQAEFYPVLDLPPGESYTVCLHRYVNQEYAGTGTGTTGELNTLRLKAENAPCTVLVEAFER